MGALLGQEWDGTGPSGFVCMAFAGQLRNPSLAGLPKAIRKTVSVFLAPKGSQTVSNEI